MNFIGFMIGALASRVARSSRIRGREGLERGAEAMNTKNTSKELTHTIDKGTIALTVGQPVQTNTLQRERFGKKVPQIPIRGRATKRGLVLDNSKRGCSKRPWSCSHHRSLEVYGGLGCNLAHARALYNPTRYDDLDGRVSPHEGVLLMEEYETQLEGPLRVSNLVLIHVLGF